MSYKAWGLYTNCESPLVVVLSESMEPAFARGDILFLSNNPKKPIEIGDICVFKIPGRGIPIVHRVLVNHDFSKPNQQYLLTKGDNNRVDDRAHLYQELYSNKDMSWVEPKHVVGRVQGQLPYLGMFTIYMTDYPMLKYALLGAVGLVVFLYE
ncbi:Signal peptidase complex catalytic subunit [Mortierella sp. NVP85]|nr:Signal peptidase complex catalytic subunit [Mortierella sp. NVP85]